MPTIAILNDSTVTTDAEVEAMVPALQQQISVDFAKYWDLDAKLLFVPKGSRPDLAYWQMVVLDDSDQAGALGYHDLTPTNKPMGKVFARADLQAGDKLSVTLSHELLEMLADPYVNLSVMNSDNGNFYAYEVCDAVEDDSLGYMINGVLVSDFVLPQWFITNFRGQVSFKSHVAAAFDLAKGGYIGYFNPAVGQWNQATNWAAAPETGAKGMLKARRAISPPVGSRRERRTFGAGHAHMPSILVRAG
jgi:hypothetical protein